MVQSRSTRSSAASISPCGVMQTGQPGPITILRRSGRMLRSPARAIAASCVPQICMSVISRSTRARSVSRISLPTAMNYHAYISTQSTYSVPNEQHHLRECAHCRRGPRSVRRSRVFRWLQKRADLTEIELDDIVLYWLDKPLCISIVLGSVSIAVTLFVDPAALLGEDTRGSSPGSTSPRWQSSSRHGQSPRLPTSFVSLYGRWIASKTETDLDDRIIRLLEVSARYVVWFIAILMILQTLEVDITPLIAGAGIAGLAVALAAQDIISNFFGGAVILMDKPFAVNERDQDRHLPRGRAQHRPPEHPDSGRWITR